MSNVFYIDKPLHYGMVGGGPISQIEDSHRVTLRRDSYNQLVAKSDEVPELAALMLSDRGGVKCGYLIDYD